jgi:hypothetical protein
MRLRRKLRVEDGLLMASRKSPHPELGAKRHVEGRTISIQPHMSHPSASVSLTVILRWHGEVRRQPLGSD